MTCLTDVRDRTLTMLRAVGIEPDRKQMRTVEKYVRWVDGQISTAHIDGRVMDREVARGHEIAVTHDAITGTEWAVRCHELAGAACRLVCDEDCEAWVIERDDTGPHHLVATLGEPIRHELRDLGECNVVAYMENDDAGIEELGSGERFEVARFPIRPVWSGHGFDWKRA